MPMTPKPLRIDEGVAGVATRATPECGDMTQEHTRTNGQIAVAARDVCYRYGDRQALSNLSFEIKPAELFAVLGPNGGGKTTLFRLLSTLTPLQQGDISLFGIDLRRQPDAVRRLIGVVFQAPSLDRKLTVSENVRLMGRLYGLTGSEITARSDQLLRHFALGDRAHELVEQLSGGLRRRVELAKCVIHEPRLLLLDEPTTGLDPAVRSDVWQYLRALRERAGLTIVFTTHYLDEAERADRLAIIHEGQIVAHGQPDDLKSAIGGDSITLEADDPAALAADMSAQFGLEAQRLDDAVRLKSLEGPQLIGRLFEAFPGRIRAVRLGKPTLEDVFIVKTGHRFVSERTSVRP